MVKRFCFLFLTGVFHLMAQANFCEEQAFAHSKSFKPTTTSQRPSEKRDLPLGSKPHDTTTGVSDYVVGVKTYRSALNEEAKALLGRDVSEKEIGALEKANRMGRAQNQKITDRALIEKKTHILKSVGFSEKEIQALMENGLVWIQPIKGSDLLIEKLEENPENIYFIDTETLTVNRVNKILERKNIEFLVEIEPLDASLRNMRRSRSSISISSNHFIPHPDIGSLFESHRLNRKTVSREDLNLPLPTNKEAELKAQGYGPAYRKGMDDLNEWSAVRRQLQELRANPYTTHIEYFADKIEAHIAFVAKALGVSTKALGISTRSESQEMFAESQNILFAEEFGISIRKTQKRQEKDLAELQISAGRAIKKEKVTYKWWLEFNDQLSFILSNRDNDRLTLSLEYKKQNKVDFFENAQEAIEKITALFPLWIMMPTLNGELGIITLNRSLSEGVFPIGLTSKTRQNHRITMDPATFFIHDITHARLSFTANNINRYLAGHRLRHKKMLELMEALPSNKRKLAELVYFNAIHERDRDVLLSHKSKKKITDELFKAVYQFLTEDINFRSLTEKIILEKIAELGPEYHRLDNTQKIQYISKYAVGVFMEEVYKKTF